MFNISDFKYQNRYYYNLNALTKFFVLFITISLALTSSNLLFLSSLLIGVLFIVWTNELCIKYFFKLIYSFKFLFVFIIFINLVDLPIMIANILIAIIIIFSSNIYVKTTYYNDIINSFHVILFPLKILKVNVENLLKTIHLAICFIPIILNLGKDILKNCECRGLYLYKSSLEDKLKILKALFIPLFRKTLRKSDTLSFNLYLRFYDQSKLTYYNTNYSVMDYLHFLGLMLLLFIWRIYV